VGHTPGGSSDGEDTWSSAELFRLEALLDGALTPGDLTAEERSLSELTAAARAPATPSDLFGFQTAAAAFATFNAESLNSSQDRRRIRRAVSISSVVAAVILVASGTAAAAYTGSLPAPLQDFAHSVLGARSAPTQPALVPPSTTTRSATAAQPQDRSWSGATPSGQPSDAPAATPTPTPTTLPRGTATPASGDHSSLPTPAQPPTVAAQATGLCRAWERMGDHANPHSAVVGSLSVLAGGIAGIPNYCAERLAVPAAKSGNGGRSHSRKPTHRELKPAGTAVQVRPSPSASPNPNADRRTSPPKPPSPPHPRPTPQPQVERTPRPASTH
jgi:hypothetical protein